MELRRNYWKSVFAGIAAATLLSLSGCRKFIEIEAPKTQVLTSAVFSDDKTALSSVVGLYSQMMNSNLFLINGGVSLYAGLSADEITNTTSNINIDPFTTNALTPTNSIVQNSLWRWGYAYIYQANSCMEGLTKSTLLTDSLKKQLIGEVKLARALCYFYLTNLFGDVPLVLTTSYELNAVMPRTSADLIYDQIIKDLIECQSELSATSPTAGTVRPNRWAATALLARVYLYRKNWANAEIEATKLIHNSNYSLPSLATVFLADSKETIWSLMPVNTFNTAEGASFIPSSGTVRPQYTITPVLLNSFENGDQRITTWTGNNVVSGISYRYPAKYKVRTGAAKTECNIILRMAEQYLIRAESRTQSGNISGAAADLNFVRNRAGLGVTAASNQADLLQAIEKERQTEFFTEWGHRWLDLKRTNRIDAVLSVNKTGWAATDALYPVPQIEIANNPFLNQNQGY